MTTHEYVGVTLTDATLTIVIRETPERTVELRFENEHAEYMVTLSHEDARDLAANIGAAASSAEFKERRARHA